MDGCRAGFVGRGAPCLRAFCVGERERVEDFALDPELLGGIVRTEAGVRVYFNPAVCAPSDGLNPSGFYISQSRQLVVCQDAGKYDGELVPFTANDLDTVRHEAQHVVQDCIDGIGDNSLVNMFPVVETQGALSLREFVATSGLSPQTLMHIFTTYTQAGADTEVLALEFEAFAVANSIDAADIAVAVGKACSVNINN